jgi:hypothetical protein
VRAIHEAGRAVVVVFAENQVEDREAAGDDDSGVASFPRMEDSLLCCPSGLVPPLSAQRIKYHGNPAICFQ